MPNGDDKNWIRVCCAIDGFRARYGRWPKRVRLMPIAYIDLLSHVLTPLGSAIVSSVVELVPEDDAEMIADDGTGAEFNYGRDGGPERELDTATLIWFGQAIMRPDLAC